MKRTLSFTVLSFLSILAWGQMPQPVFLPDGKNTSTRAACQEQYAGTIELDNFIGQSNDIDLDTIFLCKNDQFDIIHNEDSDLTGDPNPSTAPGITYAFFDCQPTTSGPNLSTILTEPCLTNDPPPINDLYVTAGGGVGGNITFTNTGSLQNTFNGGAPHILWFAPLTIDHFAIKSFEEDPVNNELGPCVHLNTDEAFSVVYLNEIELNSFSPNPLSSGCEASIEIRGGLPEFDGSNYTNISITLIGNPIVTGTVTNSTISHGDTINFTVPAPGFYAIKVEDGKSCTTTLNVNMSSCTGVNQSIQNTSAIIGDEICLDITNGLGFDNIVAIQYGITWDSGIIQFSSIESLTSDLPNFSIPTTFNVVNDTLIFAWASFGGTGVSLPSGEVIYQICFDVIGMDGDCSPIEYVVPNGFTIEVVNENGVVLGFNGSDGQICVSALSLSHERDTNLEMANIEISPNPAFDVAKCKVPHYFSLPYQLDYFNTNGQFIKREKMPTSQFDLQLQNFPKGLIFIKAIDANGNQAFGKILKQKN